MKNLIFILLISSFASCDRIKSKTKETAIKIKDKTGQEVKKQSRKIIEKVFPVFNSHTADTDNNKARFRDFLKVDLSEDVKNILCYDNAIGIDASYAFSFNCNSETSRKIIETNKVNLTVY